MKTRNLYILLMLFVLSCSKSEKQDGETASFSQNTIVNAQQDTTLSVVTEIFKGESWYKVIQDDDYTTTHIKNVTFTPLFTGGRSVIIKQTQEIQIVSGFEGQESNINIEIFDRNTNEKLRSFSVDADKIDFALNFYLTTKYGCCAAPNELELGEIWTDNVFLRAENDVFAINRQLYFGFTTVWNSKEGILGELNFARGHDNNRSFKPDKRLTFKVRDKELMERYCEVCTEISFIVPDSIPHSIGCSLYRSIWFPNGLEQINHNVIKVEFEFGAELVTVNIPIQNGLIFGNRNFEQIIYVDDFLKKSGNQVE